MNRSIPVNPYKRMPIKSRNQLVGRSAELSELDYYFRLTASVQSPHVALIGRRGIGKSSILLSSIEKVKQLGLLPAYIDLNDKSTLSQGHFWQQVYLSLCLNAAEVGCWGGREGKDFKSLLKLIECLPADDGDLLLLPQELPSYHGKLEDLSCSPSILDRDMSTILAELKQKEIKGVVLIIDEADYLGYDPVILQVLRSVFQKLDGFSIVLAGTENLFSSVSEVHSPIPRQFHKLDIKPFGHWGDTHQLVCGVLSPEYHYLLPKAIEIHDLHYLCNGDPAELQLYCHHMYKNIENGNADRMSLNPEVFRSVVQEYRTSAPEEAQRAVQQIERLPKEFFKEYTWLRLSSLTRDEAVRLVEFRTELETGKSLILEEQDQIRQQVHESYNKLFENGISSDREMLKLYGGEIVKGFWKSFVEVELGERWIWSDAQLENRFIAETLQFINERTAGRFMPTEDTDFAETILNAISLKQINKLSTVSLPDPDQDWLKSPKEAVEEVLRFTQAIDVLLSINQAQIAEKDRILRVPIVIHSAESSRNYVLNYIDYDNELTKEAELVALLTSNADLFDHYGLKIETGKPKEWRVPDETELEELQNTLGIEIGSDESRTNRRAIRLFKENNKERAVDELQQLLERHKTPVSLNNLAFAKLSLGHSKDAVVLLEQALEGKREPLFLHNLGIANLLLGDKSIAVEQMRSALDLVADQKNWEDTANLMLIVKSDCAGTYIVEEVPIIVGILASLYNIGDMTRSELSSKLDEAINGQDSGKKWLDYIVDGCKKGQLVSSDE